MNFRVVFPIWNIASNLKYGSFKTFNKILFRQFFSKIIVNVFIIEQSSLGHGSTATM